MSARPPVLRKAVKTESLWLPEESAALPKIPTATSPRSVASASTARGQSAKSVASVASTARTTIFTPKKTDDPMYRREEPAPHCTSERCCCVIQQQCGFRLLPAYEGTFGPPPPVGPHTAVYPQIAEASTPHPPSLPKDVAVSIAQLSSFQKALSKAEEVLERNDQDSRQRSDEGPPKVQPQPPSRAQRHAWILKQLSEQGKLKRATCLVASGSESRRSSAAPAVPTQPNRSSSLSRAFTASNLLVALLIRMDVGQLIHQYRSFVDRHRPAHGAILQQRARGANTFVVHHQAGLTLPQLTLFIVEALQYEMGSSTVPVSEETIASAFAMIADPTTRRLPAADLFVTIGMSIVPSVTQTNAEYFLSVFDPDRSGYVPRTVFHPLFVKKYTDRYVQQGLHPAWRCLENIIATLLKCKDELFIYLLVEVISPPSTPLALSRSNNESFDASDPAGVFASTGEGRPLAITIREALCVIYAVKPLEQFFEHNSLDFDACLK